ncbi:unnamed protein product [Phaedon cochleariae]|uniref:Nuclear hormone receptor HR96 n=1 Tax=Phaedon cochleariae TaxID=80249 RepID=A0A9P0DL70_PHACE|nr:unnamed protein product [Phaedon cochleariae]
MISGKMVKSDNKVCGVCGDKALGFNFNAVTCESCKAFFRRNALITKDFSCPFNNQCDITTVTRRFCQKCRLDKCIAIGMCKDLIMSDHDKEAKRQKIEENKAKKRKGNSFKAGFKKMKKEIVEPDSQKSECSSSTVYSKGIATDTNSQDVLSEDLEKDLVHPRVHPFSQKNPNTVSVINYNSSVNNPIENLENVSSPNERLVSSSDEVMSTPVFEELDKKYSSDQCEDHNQTCSRTKLNNYDVNCNNNSVKSNIIHSVNPESTKEQPSIENMTQDIINDVRRIYSVEPTSIESILCEAIKLEFEAFSSMAQYRSSNSRELNDAEQAKLNELIVANKATMIPVDNELTDLIGDDSKFKPTATQQKMAADPVLVDVINLTAIGIRRTIKLAKRINAFKNMCQEDQVALLKGGCTEIMLLRSAMNYDKNKQSWHIPHSIEALNVNADVLKLAKGNIYNEHARFITTFDPKWICDENLILILCAIVLFTPDRPRVVHQDVIKLEQNSYYYLLRRYLESIYPGCEAKSTFLKLIQKMAELHKVNDELISVYLDVNPSQIEPLLIEMFDLKH